MRAFLLAAGLGTRLKSLTDTTPKALVQINGVTLLELIIKRLISFGFDSIIINIHHFGDQIINFLNEKNNFGVDIKISDERDHLLDTGGGLKNVSSFFNDNKPFLVHNVDILSDLNLSELYHYHLRSNSIATLAVQNRKSSRYFLFDEDNNLCGWKNEKMNETRTTRESKGELIKFAFSGIQIIDPKIFQFMPEKNIFSLVDLYLSIASKKQISYFDHSGSLFFDLGKKENLIQAEKFYH